MYKRQVRGARGGTCASLKHKRLSATDISALASMKNVAKCDTWCELQNPVNHRVFERKLRPKPLGRGHVCLGVTQRCPPQPSRWRGRKMASRELLASRLAQKRVLGCDRRGIRWLSKNRCPVARVSAVHELLSTTPMHRSLRCFRRDPRSGGATR